MTFSAIARLSAACGFLLIVPVVAAGAGRQALPGATQAAAGTAQPERAGDALGRDTPRGTVRGFLMAARRGETALARFYLNTTLDDRDAEELARQLYIVLDTRLPARLSQISDAPEGARANPLMPGREVVGTIAGPGGNVDVVVERVTRHQVGAIWLFSQDTLARIPALYEDVLATRKDPVVRFLTGRRLGGIRLLEWLAVLLGVPAFYLLTVVLNRVLTPVLVPLWRRVFGGSRTPERAALPVPARLLMIALIGRWILSTLPLSLIARQILGNLATLVTIGAFAWMLILVNGELERYFCRRVPRANASAAISLLRVGRRGMDVLVLLAALLATLRHFGVDPTPVLAGLGVGGIAVALAAQKTLENIIAGASLIFDQAVRVGDYLKVADMEGTVEHIGLRSTRIRTLGRTVVSVPNSQIANMSLETLSARDKFWFHPTVGLRYETSADQLRAVLDGIRAMLARHASVDRDSVRVRFLRLGAFSLDVEVFAYVFARDWSHFLEIQEQLLFSVTEIVGRAGTAIAFPSQKMYVTAEPAGGGSVPLPHPPR